MTTMTTLPTIKNRFLQDWLAYTGGSESPDLFNLWTGISTIAACLGRRSYTRLGRFKTFPNQYIVLIGPPAVRKSSAGSIAEALLRKYTDVKYGPDDTGGKKQGLISTFVDEYLTDEDKAKAKKSKKKKDSKLEDKKALFEMSFLEDDKATPTIPIKSKLDSFMTSAEPTSSARTARSGDRLPADLYIFANELGTLVGLNQVEMVNFLTKIYDCRDHVPYRLANIKKFLNKPGLNILGCITPTALISHLPPSAVGEGFSSRVMFVYQATAKDKIFPAPELDYALGDKLGKQLADITKTDSAFTHTEDALELQGRLYKTYKPNINDTRFSFYEQRRGDHLTKVTICLAAGRGDTVINSQDIIDAHIILIETEKHMPHALGELGMDRSTIAKQQMKDMIVNSWPVGLPISMLQTNMMRDLHSKQEFNEAIESLVRRGVCFVSDAVAPNGGKFKMIIPSLPDNKSSQSPDKSREAIERRLNNEQST